MVIETEKDVILVDPMIGPVGTFTPFSIIRYKAKKNPIVPLPVSCQNILSQVTHCLLTHKHPDHLDEEGSQFLLKNQTPVTCSVKEERIFKKRGYNIVNVVEYWNRSSFLEGTIEGIPARHGYGAVAKLAGNVMGFYIELPNQKSIYLSSDTIYTDAVDKVLKNYKPAISVVACGMARLDFLKPLLMTMDDVLKFTQNAPGLVIANHLEAVNHCPTTRAELKQALEKNGLLDKVRIPEDGELMKIN